ncbi:ABC transporter ATP-binding protein [Streptomyces sp. AJS327]|uniref:ABC transporter ATP-binding protein n=1 Tax=Streptomyces sp. AJS327 TaxID=2545265 RepID=UPI0015E0459D|nr:ABC transporter ATP-binding protein [Streptomyces sp. AJS327]MBA0053003.1 ABC transporter ATP-binding protein [Streptomyces sp. AJS327]
MTTEATETAIDISGLVKTFGRTRALDGLDLRVRAGEVHGFLGPNGAGKSTTIRVLLGLLRADAGSVRLLGSDPWKHAVALHRRLAYVPGDVELWPNLTGGEAIDLLTRLRGGPPSGRRARAGEERRRAELIERFQLDPGKKGRTYSKGNRQKVAIVAALASDAELLLLDEPTAGLDPLMEVAFQETIAEATERGRTVLLSSHILAQVEKLCDRVSIIRLGRIVQSGSLGELRHLTRTTIEVETERPVTGLAELPGVHDVRELAALDGPVDPATEGAGVGEARAVRFSVDGGHLDEVVRRLATFGVRGLVSHPPTLEELMLRHYGDELGVTAAPSDPARVPPPGAAADPAQRPTPDAGGPGGAR